MIVPGDGLIDLSIMPTLWCDLECPHCQYNAGPKHKGKTLYWREIHKFLFTVDWNDINSIGFYGGEVFLDMGHFAMYIDLVKDAQLQFGIKKHKFKPMWVISNGTFSTAQSHFSNVVAFVHMHNLRVFISTTPHHKEHQHPRIKNLAKISDNFSFKKDDTKSRLLPMGRNATEDWYCTRRCQRQEETERLAIMPNGDIIYQKCDGVYPVLGSIRGNHVSYQTAKYYMKNYLKCPMLSEDADLGGPSWIKHAEKAPG
jgi:hypothetical protein